MPILIANKRYNNVFNPTQNVSFYRSNVGDRVFVELDVHSSVIVRSVNNPLQFDNFVNEITSASTSFISEGFRVGDSIVINKYDSGGTIISSETTTINYFDGSNTIGVSALSTTGYDISTESIAIILSGRNRADLDILINHVPNGQQGSAASLIDGELTRFKFLNLDPLAVSGTQNGIIIPNQSGEFLQQFPLEIERLANYNSFTRVYRIKFSFITNGIYDQSLFSIGNCLKTYYRLEWSSLPNEIQNKSVLIDSEEADTGWFGQAYNSQAPESEIIFNSLNELSYCNDTTFEIKVQSDDFSEVGIGGAYISVEDSYFKNKPETQGRISMLLDTSNVFTNIGVPKQSPQNTDFADYQIIINSAVISGNELTINATFFPQNNFAGFMGSRDSADRLFYLWIKCGNTNHLVYSSQLVCPPIPLGPLDMLEENAFLQHYQNTETALAVAGDISFNTEDDIAFSGVFEVEKTEEWDSVNVIVEAFNSVTNQRFTLQSVIFSLAGVQISSDGKYLVNESQTIITSLPTTSQKRNARLTLDSLYETATTYGMRIYYPFLLRWEYWLAQSNANVDFYPDQNKNWFPYDNTGDWSVRLKLELQKGTGAKINISELNILDYDSNPNIISTTELSLFSSGQVVNAVIEGEIHVIKTTHELISGVWDLTKLWGMITVEPTEASRRWILSTIVPHDNNSSNPLSPISGNVASVNLVSPSIVEIFCLFDPSKINLSNGVKFTGKIKQQCDAIIDIIKETTDGDLKLTTDNLQKIIS